MQAESRLFSLSDSSSDSLNLCKFNSSLITILHHIYILRIIVFRIIFLSTLTTESKHITDTQA